MQKLYFNFFFLQRFKPIANHKNYTPGWETPKWSRCCCTTAPEEYIAAMCSRLLPSWRLSLRHALQFPPLRASEFPSEWWCCRRPRFVLSLRSAMSTETSQGDAIATGIHLNLYKIYQQWIWKSIFYYQLQVMISLCNIATWQTRSTRNIEDMIMINLTIFCFMYLAISADPIALHPHPVFRLSKLDSNTGSADCCVWRWNSQM